MGKAKTTGKAKLPKTPLKRRERLERKLLRLRGNEMQFHQSQFVPLGVENPPPPIERVIGLIELKRAELSELDSEARQIEENIISMRYAEKLNLPDSVDIPPLPGEDKADEDDALVP